MAEGSTIEFVRNGMNDSTMEILVKKRNNKFKTTYNDELQDSVYSPVTIAEGKWRIKKM